MTAHTLAAFWQALSPQELTHPARWIADRSNGLPAAVWVDGHEIRPTSQGELAIMALDSPFASSAHADLVAHLHQAPADTKSEVEAVTLSQWIARAAQATSPAAESQPHAHTVPVPRAQAQARRSAQDFEQRMRAARLHFALGQRLLSMHALADRPVVQWHHHNRMVAVACLTQQQVGLTPLVTAAELRDARVSTAPAAAADIPNSFERVSLAHLMWTTAQQSVALHLPKAARKATFHFKRHPDIPTRLLRERHLHLLDALQRRSASLAELHQLMPRWSEILEHDLASLMLAGAVENSAPHERKPSKWWFAHHA